MIRLVPEATLLKTTQDVVISGDLIIVSNQKYNTEIVREIFDEDGWELLNEYPGNGKQPLYIRNPQAFNNHVCKTTLTHWLNGKRPNFKSLIDKTEYIREEFYKEGWTLASEYENYEKPLLIYKPDFYKGEICQMYLASWFSGHRPGFKSIVNQDKVVKDALAQEGWNLIGDYKSYTSKMMITNPNVLDGHNAYATWCGWCQGYRPNFQSLVNKDEYVRSQVEKEGWELIKSCGKVADYVSIKHPNHFNNYATSIQWRQWECGFRPTINNVINATEYIGSILAESNMVIMDPAWKYKLSDEYFRIKCLTTNRDYAINWSKIAAGYLPGTPKYRIRCAIASFYRRRNTKKPFSTTILPESYWKELEEKIPYVPKDYQIDHVVCLSFFGQSWEQVLLANEARNLRLLPAKENMIRSNNLRASELDEYDLWDLYYQAENPDGHQLIEDRCDLAS